MKKVGGEDREGNKLSITHELTVNGSLLCSQVIT
jgi:hypothetical protein